MATLGRLHWTSLPRGRAGVPILRGLADFKEAQEDRFPVPQKVGFFGFFETELLRSVLTPVLRGLDATALCVDSGSSQSIHCANNEVDFILSKPTCTVLIPFPGPAPEYESATSYYSFEIVRGVTKNLHRIRSPQRRPKTCRRLLAITELGYRNNTAARWTGRSAHPTVSKISKKPKKPTFSVSGKTGFLGFFERPWSG